MKKIQKTFAMALAEQCERHHAELEAPSGEWLLRFLITRIRKIERDARFADPEVLLERVLMQFGRYSSPSSELLEWGPWASFIVCAEIDRDGALRFMTNVIRAELERVMPERWTA